MADGTSSLGNAEFVTALLESTLRSGPFTEVINQFLAAKSNVNGGGLAAPESVVDVLIRILTKVMTRPDYRAALFSNQFDLIQRCLAEDNVILTKEIFAAIVNLNFSSNALRAVFIAFGQDKNDDAAN